MNRKQIIAGDKKSFYNSSSAIINNKEKIMATVFIWNNHENGRGHKWAGHASLSITDQFASAYEENNSAHNFVSWIPSDDTSHRGKDQGLANENIFNDLIYEGYAPDHIIRLDIKPSDENLMKTEWTKIKSKKATYTSEENDKGEMVEYLDEDSGPSFRLYRKNCSVIVQRVIKAANLPWKNKEIIARKSIIWTPLNVKRLVNSIIGAENILWSQFVDELKSKNCISEIEKDYLKKFQRRHESRGSSVSCLI